MQRVIFILLAKRSVITILNYTNFIQGVGGALAVLMKDAIRPNLMQTLEVNS